MTNTKVAVGAYRLEQRDARGVGAKPRTIYTHTDAELREYYVGEIKRGDPPINN